MKTRYVSLVLLALAFGWIEGSVVVYLREIYEAGGLNAPVFPLVFLSERLTRVEIVREACTLVVLGVVACLADRRWAARIGSFLLLFGIWDLTYYGVLKLILDWPASLTTWDILFLIPLPWIAPVWAPVLAAAVFVVVGSYLFWTSARSRTYGWTDAAILFASAFTIVAAFLADWRIAVEQQVPQRFHAWLFWAGVALGVLWFVRTERGVTAGSRVVARKSGSPLQTRGPDATHLAESAVKPGTDRSVSGPASQTADAVIADYRPQKRKLDTLLEEATAIGDLLQRLGGGLRTHPARLVLDSRRESVEDPHERDVMTIQSLPTVSTLIELTDDIRETARRVEDLRERLILMGRSDIVEQPDEFFH
jgi:hypothetical protein